MLLGQSKSGARVVGQVLQSNILVLRLSLANLRAESVRLKVPLCLSRLQTGCLGVSIGLPGRKGDQAEPRHMSSQGLTPSLEEPIGPAATVG